MIKICSKCGEEREIVVKTTLCSLCVKERRKEYNKRFADKNREKERIRGREYYKHNKEKHLKSCLNWREKNKEHFLKVDSIRKKIDRKLRPHVYVWRDSLKSALERLGRKKEGNTIDLLGYSALELKEHIEKKFLQGMSWNNYGEWEIDHIKEICTFDKDTPINIVNSLDNLQPLWRKDNWNKWLELKNKLNEHGLSCQTQ